MIGIIDVGGGSRGAYGAGVLDWCLDNGVKFDYAIGVSAGSANITSYAAGQRGRCHKFYTDYFMRWQYMSFRNMLKTGNYIGLDYIYSTLSNDDGEYPVDWDAMAANPMEMITVATNALTGEPKYFDKSDVSRNNYHPMKGSSCVPVANRPYVIDGVPYYDGGISDPVPIKKALADGCDKVLLILTRPRDFRRVSKKDFYMAKLMRKYPAAAAGLVSRAETYNASLDYAEKLAAEGKVIILAPDSIGKMKTLTKDPAAIQRLYDCGYNDAAAAASELLKMNAERK